MIFFTTRLLINQWCSLYSWYYPFYTMILHNCNDIMVKLKCHTFTWCLQLCTTKMYISTRAFSSGLACVQTMYNCINEYFTIYSVISLPLTNLIWCAKGVIVSFHCNYQSNWTFSQKCLCLISVKWFWEYFQLLCV